MKVKIINWAYFANIALSLFFIWSYVTQGKDDVLWLFAATFTIIRAEAGLIRDEIEAGRK